ncbi:hypothetical protein GGI22_006822, partial [Coemansia erecta]
PRGRLRSSSTKKKGAKDASKKRERGDGVGSETKSVKKARVADALVPSTSGVTVKAADDANDSSGQNTDKTQVGGPSDTLAINGGHGDNNKGNGKDESAVPANIPAPVPTATKMGGIKLKLIGSQ